MRRALALAMLALSFGCTERQPPPATAGAAETISIDSDYTGDVCIGLCLDRRITVASDGRVEVLDRSRHASEPVRRWRVAPRLAAQFFATMAAIRPAADRDLSDPCTASEDCVRDFREVITWSGSGGSVRLRATGPGPQRVHCTVTRAVIEIGIDYPTGRRTRPRRAPDASWCRSSPFEDHEN